MKDHHVLGATLEQPSERQEGARCMEKASVEDTGSTPTKVSSHATLPVPHEGERAGKTIGHDDVRTKMDERETVVKSKADLIRVKTKNEVEWKKQRGALESVTASVQEKLPDVEEHEEFMEDMQPKQWVENASAAVLNFEDMMRSFNASQLDTWEDKQVEVEAQADAVKSILEEGDSLLEKIVELRKAQKTDEAKDEGPFKLPGQQAQAFVLESGRSCWGCFGHRSVIR